MKKTLGKKKMTMDILATMVAKGFDEVHKKFDVVNVEIGEVKDSIQAVRGDILSLSDRSVKRYEFDELKTRFDRLEQKVEEKIK